MAKRGRPRVIDAEVRELLVGLVQMGCTRKQAARHAGVAPSTLFLTLKSDKSFAAQLRRAEMQQNITPLRRILQHSEKSWRAAAWILERQDPNRYARRPPLMVTKADSMAFLKSVLGFLVKGACANDQQLVADNLQRLDQLLGGHDATTPRGRSAVRQMAAEDENSRTAGNFRTAPDGPENPEIRGPICENAGFEQGRGI